MDQSAILFAVAQNQHWRLDDMEIRKVKVKVGDIIEFVHTSDSLLNQRGFG